jgi:uncharacterized protein
MFRAADRLVLSANDVTDVLACRHLTQLERRVALGELDPPADSASLEAIARRGAEHEQRWLERFEREGRRVVRIARGDRDAARAATIAAMRDGADVVYQAALFDGRWLGYADFLLRVDVPSQLGDWSYEVADTKLARSVRVSALIQMGVYSAMVTDLQGVQPRQMHVMLGDGRTVSYGVDDSAAYCRAARRHLEEAIASAADAYPEPCEHCAICRWADRCERQRRDDDHLSLVPFIRRDQIGKLGRAGVSTVAELAALGDRRVPHLARDTAARLGAQAALQVAARADGAIHHEVLNPGPGLGLAALPEPSSGDLFFDMEGDPLVEDGGLEYLFGVAWVEDGVERYRSFWAHDRAAEKRAFEQLVDLVIERLERDPNLHVYHYGAYEASALRRLAGAHATRETEVDRLLRGEVLVDLYRVVRQGLRVSTESYSIKKLEPLYMPKREAAITDAGSSIVEYERWLDVHDQKILDDIEEYNRDDCISTMRLRDWLEEQRRSLGGSVTRPSPRDAEPSAEVNEADARAAALVEKLTAGIAEDPSARTPDEQARWTLAQLVGWHRREDKPVWWEHFHRMGLGDEELIDDSDALGGLTFDAEVRDAKGRAVNRYRFEPGQDHKIQIGRSPRDPATNRSPGSVDGLDEGNGTIDVRPSRNWDGAHPRALIPFDIVPTSGLRDAIARVAVDPGSAIWGVLRRDPPRLSRGAMREPAESAQDAAVRIATALDGSYLPIQGPPGTGKTYVGARIVNELVGQGRRVGITGPNHKAISGLLAAACARSARPFQAIQKADPHDAVHDPSVKAVGDNGRVERAVQGGTVQAVAGTPWLFALPALDGQFDTLIVDEAGQFSLANLVAVSGAARNIVLLGDPQQLAQPSQGIHPPGAGVSALEHILDGAATIDAARGVLLDRTRRMHPSICRFISEVAYDGRLESEASCAIQRVDSPGPINGAGLWIAPVEHADNRTASSEEARRVAELYASLVGETWTHTDGVARTITDADILVVAPYNAQVSRLRSALPRTADVGTVDRFQGREGAVVIYSMAASDPDDITRGLDFLYSLNRLNVAISRARCAAILVCSPALLLPRCRTPEELRLANALCRYAELATTLG